MALPAHQPVDSQQQPALAHAAPCAANAAIQPCPASIAVIDVETTGLSPRCGDRIVELAIVVIHAHGPILREFVTLLNPERDIGPTHIHGLTASDVRHAPRFADVAGLVTETLAGCTAIAGHNIAFDHRFLRAEFERLNQYPSPPASPDPLARRRRSPSD
jgi:DNA polymerase III epsilon subunit-like protein